MLFAMVLTRTVGEDDGFGGSDDGFGGSDDGFEAEEFPSEDEDEEDVGLSLAELDEIPTAQNNAPSEIPGVSEHELEEYGAHSLPWLTSWCSHSLSSAITEMRERFHAGGSKQASERLLRDFAIVQHTDTKKFVRFRFCALSFARLVEEVFEGSLTLLRDTSRSHAETTCTLGMWS